MKNLKSKKLIGAPIWTLASIIAGVLVVGTLAYILLDENQFLWAGDVEISSNVIQEYITFEGVPITNENGEFTFTEMDFPPESGLKNGDDITITKTFESFTGDSFTIEFDLTYLPTDEIWTGVAISIFETGTTTPLSIITLDPGATETFDINYNVDPLWLEPIPDEHYPFDLRMYIEKVLWDFENYANLVDGAWLCNDAGTIITDYYENYDGDLDTGAWGTFTDHGGCLDLTAGQSTIPNLAFPYDENDDFGIAFWIDPATTSGTIGVFEKYIDSAQGFFISRVTNKLRVKICDSSANNDLWVTDNDVFTGGFQHIAINFDGATSKIDTMWVDGVSEAFTETIVGVTGITTTTDIILGRQDLCQIDEIVICDGLDQTAVDYLYAYTE